MSITASYVWNSVLGLALVAVVLYLLVYPGIRKSQHHERRLFLRRKRLIRQGRTDAADRATTN